MQRHQSQVVDALTKLGYAYASAYPRMETGCDRLADLGWTITMDMDPFVLARLADDAVSDAELEQTFSSLYTEDDFRQLRAIERELLEAQPLAPCRALISEAFEAYYRGLHQIPVPALMATIEGVIAREAGKLNTRVTAVRKLAADLEARAPRQSVEALMWRSVRRWIDNMYADSNFSSPQPPQLNRHWILHGRDSGPWSKTDAIRLFVALNTMT